MTARPTATTHLATTVQPAHTPSSRPPKTERIGVTWRLAPGIASALRDLAEYSDAEAGRQRIYSRIVTDLVSEEGNLA